MPTWYDFRKTDSINAWNVREPDNIRDLTTYAIQSQYAASPHILALLAGYQLNLELTQDIDLFYEKIFNIYTAEGWGLDNWGRILGISRLIEDEDTDTTLNLSDDLYRALLLYKALANISSSDAATLNSLLNVLINTGISGFPNVAYVLEVDTMVIRWVFEDFLTDEQLAVFKVAGTLARGAGVGWELYAINPDQVFGFDGSGMHPFNQRPFAPDNALVIGR